MKHARLFGVALTFAIVMAGAMVIGGSEQAAPAAAAKPAGGPFDSLHFRPIGPASMSGRISDVAVYEANPAIYYVATAHGGVWKTRNNGTTFEAQFQDQGLMSIGDVTISQSNPGPRLGGHGRIQQPPEHVVGRRRLQVDRRRQDLRQRGPSHLPPYPPHRHRPARQQRRVRGGHRKPVGARRRARRLQDDRWRQDLEAGAEGRR